MKSISRPLRLRKYILLPSLLVLGLVSNSRGASTVVPLSSPSDFGPGVRLITFAGVPVFSHPTVVNGVGFQMENGLGPDVSSVSSTDRPREYGPGEATFINNVTSTLDLNIYFPGPMSQIGFELQTWPSGTIDLTFLSGNSVIETLSIPSRSTGHLATSPFYFYGFQSSTGVDHLLLGVRDAVPYDWLFNLDNLSFVPVPEPGVITIGLAGISACWIAWRRRRGNS